MTTMDGRAPEGSKYVLAVPAFRRLWLGDSGSRLGFQIAEFLLPLAIVTQSDASATLVGLVTAVQFAPVIVFALYAGAIVERLPIRTLLVVCNAVRGGTLAVVAVLCAGSDDVGVAAILVAAAVLGTASVFYDVAFQCGLPAVVRPDHLVGANSLVQASSSVTQMIGPAAAGLLLQAAGTTSAFAVTGACFFAAVLGMFGLRFIQPPSPRPNLGTLSRIRVGLAFTWRHRMIRDLCTQSGLFNLHEQAFLTVFLIYAVRGAGLDGGEVGLIIGAASIGTLAGALAISSLGRRLHAGKTTSAALLIGAAALLVVPILPGGGGFVVGAGLAFVVYGAALAAYNVFAVSLRQTLTPVSRLPAVTASYRLVSFGPVPLGALAGGVLADTLGPRLALIVVGIAFLVSSGTLLFSPVRGIREVSRV